MKKSVFKKITASVLCFLLMLAMMPTFGVVQTSAATYLFQDSFETVFETIPPGWYAYAGTSHDHVSFNNRYHTNGYNSVRLTDSSPTGGKGLISGNFAVEAEKEYTATVDVYASRGEAEVYLLMYDATGTVIGSAKAKTATTQTWEHLVINAVAPPRAVSAAILFYIGEAATGDVLFDNVLVTTGTTIGLSTSGNLAYHRRITTNIQYGNGTHGWQKAVDGSISNYFCSSQSSVQTAGYLTIDLGAVANINRVTAYEYENKISRFNIAVSKDNVNWQTVSYQTTVGAKKIIDFATVQARYVKLSVEEASSGFGFHEVEVFNTSTATTFPNGAPAPAPVATAGKAEVADISSYKDENFHIYLCLGQSNMVGGDEVLWEDRTRTDGVYLLNFDEDWEYAQSGPGAMKGYNRYAETSISNNDPTLGVAGMSPAQGFAMAIAPLMKKDVGIGIICQSVSGTSIDQWQKGSGDNLYELAVSRTKAAIEKHGGVLKGILWSQGESCAARDDYLTELNKVVTGLRKDLGVTAAEVPFIATSYQVTRPVQNTNIAKIATVVANSDYIVPDGTETYEGVHFIADSQRLRGVRLAEKILSKVYGITKTEKELYLATYGEEPPAADKVASVSAEPFTKGSGTASDPYQVSTIGQLYNVRNYPKAHFEQTANIEEPLSEPIPAFSGTYDGQGYSINLQINKKEVALPAGFILELQAPGVLKNMVTKGSVGTNTAGAAALAVTVATGGTQVLNCTNYADVQGGARVGGLIGSGAKDMVITNCKNYGTVNGGMYVGGIIGVNTSVNLTRCANFGAVSSTDQTGGIAGQHNAYGTVSECYNFGDITGTGADAKTGGIVGGLRAGHIANCYNLGNIKGSLASGIAVFFITTNSTIKNVYSTASAPMYQFYNTTVAAPGTNMYQLSGTDGDLAQVTYLTLDSLKALTAAQLGDSSAAVWNTATAMPTLKNNPQAQEHIIREVTFTTKGNGTIAPETRTWYRNGDTFLLDVVPDAGNIVESVTVNGTALSGIAAGKQTICIPPVTADTEVKVTFKAPALAASVKNTKGVYKIYFDGIGSAYNLYLYTGSQRPATPTISNVTTGTDITAYLTQATRYNAVLSSVTDGQESMFGAPAIVDASFLYGSGTEEDPFRVKTIAHLNNVRNYSDKHFEQIADITQNFTTPIPEFSGTYDGKGYSINLALNSSTAVGFILQLKEPGVLKNIVTRGTVKTTNNTNYSGALVAEVPTNNTVSILNCVNYAKVDGSSRLGGMIGNATAKTTVKNCVNHGNVSGGMYVGGIFAVVGSGNVTGCANYGSVTGTQQVGGIVGQLNVNGTLAECFNVGAVTVTGNTGGGIVGAIRAGKVANCYNHGAITGSSTGGIATYLSNATAISLVSNSYNTDTKSPAFASLSSTDFAETNVYQLSADKTGTQNGITYLDLNGIKGLTAAKLGDTTAAIWKTAASAFPALANAAQPQSYNMWQVSFTVSGNGGLSQLSPLWVKDGASVSVTVSPAAGETVVGIKVNGTAVANVSTGTHTFTVNKVTADTVIAVEFTGTALPVNVKNTQGTYTVNFEGTADSYNLYVYTGATRPAQPTKTGITSGANISSYITEGAENNVVISTVVGGAETVFSTAVIADAKFFYGDGSEGNPYRIKTLAHLKNVSNALDKHFIQLADITEDLTAPLSTATAPFTGVYDGNGKSVKLNFNLNDSTGTGLFGVLQDATVKNVTVTGTITHYGNYLGGIAGETKGTVSILKCVNQVDMMLSNCNNVGGIVGNTFASTKTTIEDCVNEGDIGNKNAAPGTTTGKWSTNVGGIAGQTAASTVINRCVNKGDVTSARHAIGGLVGSSYCTVTNSYNTGNVTAGTRVASISGLHRSGKIAENCYNLGTITATDNGGVAVVFATCNFGNANTSVANCYNAGEVIASEGQTGLIVYTAALQTGYGATYTNCYVLTADAAADGLSGITGITAVTPATLKTAALGNGFTYSATAAYPYPQIVNNLQDAAWDFAKLTVSAAGNGTSSDTGSKYVKKGSTKTLTLTPASGCEVGKITYDGNEVFVNADGNYTTPAINKDVEVLVIFVQQGGIPVAMISMPKAFIPAAKNGSITFGTITMGDGVTVKEYGVVYSATQTAPEIGIGDAVSLKANKENAPLNFKNQFGVYLLGNKLTGTSYYTRPYVIYTDTIGEHIAYGAVVPVNLK